MPDAAERPPAPVASPVTDSPEGAAAPPQEVPAPQQAVAVETEPTPPAVQAILVPAEAWRAVYDTAFGIETDPGWRHEVSGIGIPGLAFPEIGRNQGAVARLRALGGNPERRIILQQPRLEEWQWGDSLSITVDLNADRLTYLRWSPKALPWPLTRDRLAGWQVIQTEEDGDAGTMLGRPIADPQGPVLIIAPANGRVIVLEVTWSLPGRFSA